MLEQSAGIAYIAVIVSLLIGLTINRLRDKKVHSAYKYATVPLNLL